MWGDCSRHWRLGLTKQETADDTRTAIPNTKSTVKINPQSQISDPRFQNGKTQSKGKATSADTAGLDGPTRKQLMTNFFSYSNTRTTITNMKSTITDVGFTLQNSKTQSKVEMAAADTAGLCKPDNSWWQFSQTPEPQFQTPNPNPQPKI